MKNSILYFGLLLVLIFKPFYSNAQESFIFDRSLWLQENTKPESVPNTLYFKQEKKIGGIDIFEKHKVDFGLSDDYKMQLYKTETDELGFVHYRFQEIYKGLKIDDAQFFVHEKEGSATTASGLILNDLKISVFPKITAEQAFQYAINGDKNAMLLQDIELLITRASYNMEAISVNYRLAYKVSVQFHNKSKYAIYIDALNGANLKNISLIINCEVGTCQTLYNGQKSLNTNYRGSFFNDYQLVDFCHGVGIHTYLGGYEPTDTDNNWSLQSERGATSAHWAVGMAWDYFYSVHGRSGTNNNNGGIDVHASDTGSPLNASFGKQTGENNHDKIIIGAGDGGVNSTDYATIDVVAHEFTHGVTAYSAGLIYSYESGALNESYSDIFGEMVERYNNSSCDYVNGAEHASNYYHKRSMINPSLNNSSLSLGAPDTYLGTYWYSGTGDNGGVHINSSVQNFWFYLLAEGGSGTNDNGQVYSVQGIGATKAAAITYRSLTQYMGMSSGFLGARNHAIIAAEDLYGSCSNEAIQTANAWYAVGVGSTSPAFNKHICGDKYGTEINSAINELTAGTAGACSYTTIHNGANVVFKSANEIDLLPGFTAEANSLFEAYIDPCSVTSRNLVISDGENTESGDIVLSIESNEKQILEKLFIIVPNPNNGIFTIKFSNLSDETNLKNVKVYDVVGKLILEHQSLATNVNIDMLSNPLGVYYVQVLYENGVVETRKLIKQ